MCVCVLLVFDLLGNFIFKFNVSLFGFAAFVLLFMQRTLVKPRMDIGMFLATTLTISAIRSSVRELG